MNTTKIEPSRILMIPQYRVLICLFTGGQILFVIKKKYTCSFSETVTRNYVYILPIEKWRVFKVLRKHRERAT